MAIGFGACIKQQLDRDIVWSPAEDPDAPPPDLDLGPGFLPLNDPNPSQPPTAAAFDRSQESQEASTVQNATNHSNLERKPILSNVINETVIASPSSPVTEDQNGDQPVEVTESFVLNAVDVNNTFIASPQSPPVADQNEEQTRVGDNKQSTSVENTFTAGSGSQTLNIRDEGQPLEDSDSNFPKDINDAASDPAKRTPTIFPTRLEPQ